MKCDLKLFICCSQRDEQIRELQEKLENSARQHRSEIDALKSKLSMERREREKDETNHGAVLR